MSFWSNLFGKNKGGIAVEAPRVSEVERLAEASGIPPEKIAIPDDVHAEITRLCQRGDFLADNESYQKAIETYNEAWNLIPDPKEDWNASTWVLAAIGEAYLFDEKLEKAKDAFDHAVRCPGGLGNSFVHFSLGQINFDLGNMDRAADELMRAYMADGTGMFEQADPKYYEFLKTRAKGLE